MTADFLPPRQTGLADFPHPAFAGRCCAWLSQGDESQSFELRVDRAALGGTPCPLTAAAQVPRQAFPHEAVDLPEGHAAVSYTVVVGPSFEVEVEPSDQVGRGRVALVAACHFPQPPALARQRFLGGVHVPVACASPVEIVVAAEAISQEVEGLPFASQIKDPRFLPVDFQPQPSLDLLFHEPLEAFSRVAGQNDKIVGVAHEDGFGPAGRSVLGMERVVEPV